jgi:hypothetical protein
MTPSSPRRFFLGRPTHWGHTFLSVAQRGVTQLFAGGEPLAGGEMGDLAGVLDRVAGVVGVGEQFKRLGLSKPNLPTRLFASASTIDSTKPHDAASSPEERSMRACPSSDSTPIKLLELHLIPTWWDRAAAAVSAPA